MNIERGFRNKLSALCNVNEPIDILVNISGNAEYDFSFFGLSEDNKLTDENYMIFYNQLESPQKELVLKLEKNSAHLQINFHQFPLNIKKIVSAICIDGKETMHQIQKCSFQLFQNKQEILTLELNGEHFQDEKAIIGLEFYQKGTEWRINAVARGFNGGLQALLESFGGLAADPIPLNPGKISLEKKLEKAPDLLNLVKPIKITLEKYKIADLTAKVAIVIDISGSMTERYKNGSVQMIVEKTLPLAVQFDDDGQLDCWYFGTTCKKMNNVTLDNYRNAVPSDWKKLMTSLGGSNTETVVMKEVIDTFHNSSLPVYVLFISDGGVHGKNKIKSLMKEASQYPIFWQFMGVGGYNYGILEQLDTMTNRVVDNAGFFAIDDFRTISNEDLYERLLSEFPKWLQKVKMLHII